MDRVLPKVEEALAWQYWKEKLPQEHFGDARGEASWMILSRYASGRCCIAAHGALLIQDCFAPMHAIHQSQMTRRRKQPTRLLTLPCCVERFAHAPYT